MNLLAFVGLVCAAVPCVLFLLNLLEYRRLPKASPSLLPSLSVLIPARDEEANLPATLKALLSNQGSTFEVIVLDDHSTDRTAAIVNEASARDARVRLATAPLLPPGWCGKQHACHVLAKLARAPLLVFLDADVRLAPDALRRLASFMEQTPAALASGVPHQQLGSILERLLLPLIHFILLGFLPIAAMRRTRWPAMSAGCGQLFVARRDAYHACGGHANLAGSLHDGLKLPRVFRAAGLATDLFDATDIADCRMYFGSGQTWQGLGKNATEGLAAPVAIVPMTLLLLGGQVLPLLILACLPILSSNASWYAAIAALCSVLPRLLACWRFRQPLGSALLHPLGILVLLAIQWAALFRFLLGRPAEWKGRQYAAAGQVETVNIA